MGNSNIGDVLSGNQSIKVDIGVDVKSAILLGVSLFLTGLLLVIISKKI